MQPWLLCAVLFALAYSSSAQQSSTFTQQPQLPIPTSPQEPKTTASKHQLIDMQAILQGVHAARMEVEIARADPAKAFGRYLSKFQALAAPRGHTVPGDPSDSRSKAERLRIFEANLQRVAARNAASSSAVLAYGITPFMHLTQEEFERLYLGSQEDTKVEEAEPLPMATWTADSGVVSRRLLGYTQTPALPPLPPMEASAPAPAPPAPAAAAAAAAAAAELLHSLGTPHETSGTGSPRHGNSISNSRSTNSSGGGDSANSSIINNDSSSIISGSGSSTSSNYDTSNSVSHDSSNSTSSSNSTAIDDGAMELPAPPAPAAGMSTQAMPPAMRLPAAHQGASRVVKSPAALPTLPYNPELGAGGCSAQRSYPFSDVVPPADGVNWVLAGGTTPVKDQGLCGSCVAFATTALAEFMHMRKYGTTNTTTDLSEQDLLDCTLGDGCQGQYSTAYINLIGCSGIAMEGDGPYRAVDGGTEYCKPHRRYSGMSHGQGGGWAAFINSPDTLAQAVSQAPALVTLDATDWALYAGGILDCDTPGKTTNHAVAVVGYVNGVTQPNGELWDFFIVRNSFGSWWGGGNGPYAGHMLIRKGCNVTAESTGGPSGLHMMEGSVPLYG